MVFDHELMISRLRELNTQLCASDKAVEHEIDAIVAGLTERRSTIVAKLQRVVRMIENYPQIAAPPVTNHVSVRTLPDHFDEETSDDNVAGVSTAAA